MKRPSIRALGVALAALYSVAVWCAVIVFMVWLYTFDPSAAPRAIEAGLAPSIAP